MKQEQISTLRALTKGKTVLVTGASSGLGEAVCNCFFDAGFSVHTIERSQPLNDFGITRHKCDVRFGGEVTQVVEKLVSDSSSIDVVVHCAGVYLDGPDENRDIRRRLQESMEINSLGTLNLLTTCVQFMEAQGYGQFIYVGSSWADLTQPSSGGMTYKASKIAAESLVATFSASSLNSAIQIITFKPPKMATRMSDMKGTPPDEVALDLLSLSLHRIAQRRINK